MMRIVWIFAFFGTITSGACSIRNVPHHSRWLFPNNLTKQLKPERSLCTTKQCVNLANILTKNLNKNADPCDDFYEYACGNWKTYNPLPPDEERWSLIMKSQRNIDRRLEEILKSEPKPEDLHAVRFTKRAYNACMDTDEMDKAGLQPLVSTLWRAGGWPLIMEEEEWDEEIYKWQTVDDYYAGMIGANAFHNLHVDRYRWDSEDLDIIIFTPHLPRNMGELLTLDEIDTDSSDENNDSGEGSQEKGSEEKHKNDKDDEGDEGDEGDEEDDEDEFYLRRKKRFGRTIDNKLINKKRTNKQLNIRAKRTIIEVENKPTRIFNHNVKRTNKFFNRNPVSQSDSIKLSTTDYNKSNNRKLENTNGDLYFNNNPSVNEDIDLDDANNEEENSNLDRYEDDDDDGSGNGDYNDNEEGEESGSGSGDYVDDDEEDEDGSGSGDREDDNEDDDNSSEERRKKAMEDKRKVEEARKRYVEYMLNVSMALAEARGVPVPKEKLEKDVADLLEFQINFIKIVRKYGGELNITLELFQKKYDCLVPTTNNGKINWIKKIQNVFSSGGMEIDKKTRVIIPFFRYIKSLRKLLDKTPSKTIVNYVHWNFLSKVIKTTTKEMRDWYYSWDNTEITVKERSELCITEIKAEYSLGYAYIKKYFSDDIIQTASDMIDDIQMEVGYQIKQSTWMDAKTKHFILDKLVYMKKLIGYPDSYRNDTIMKQYFKGISATQSHYENMLTIMRYLKWQRLKAIFTKELGPDEIDTDPLVVNAFFMAFYNAIEITAADFQSPIFDFHQPWYTNFGAIGTIMAHEVNHGFDKEGRFFDKYGKYMAWLPAMAEAYEKRAECFEDQFTKYSVVDNKTGNIQIERYGIQTENENIADSMGLEATFKAYQRRQRVCQEPDPMLPGLEEFSNEQLLFLSFASLWCEVMDPKELEKQVKRDSHSLAPLRLIGSVSNSPDFAKSFNCPEGSPMNPKKKCNIWK